MPNCFICIYLFIRRILQLNQLNLKEMVPMPSFVKIMKEKWHAFVAFKFKSSHAEEHKESIKTKLFTDKKSLSKLLTLQRIVLPNVLGEHSAGSTHRAYLAFEALISQKRVVAYTASVIADDCSDEKIQNHRLKNKKLLSRRVFYRRVRNSLLKPSH